MTLRLKIISILALSSFLAVGLIYQVTRGILIGSFTNIEEREVQTDLERVGDALAEDLSVLTMKGKDWAAWDDTRDFINGKKPDYVEQNLNAPSLKIINMNFMIFVDRSKKLVFARSMDLDKEKEVPTSNDLLQYLLADKDLLSFANTSEAKKGLAILPKELALVAVLPVSNSQCTGPVNGVLIVGRYWGKKEIDALGQRTHLNVSLLRSGEGGVPEEFIAGRNTIKARRSLIKPLSDGLIAGYSRISDIRRTSDLFFKVEMPRVVMSQGKASVNYALMVVTLAGSVQLVVLLALLHFVVLKPLSVLKAHVAAIGNSKDLSARLTVTTRDEIGVLGREFNNMAESLQRGIAERERALTDLAQSEEKYTQLFETESDSIFLLDGDTGQILDANPAAQDLYGYDLQRFRTLTHRDIVASPDGISVKPHHGPLKSLLTYHRKRDGSIFPVEVSVASFQWHERTIVTGTVRDVSDRVEAEAERTKLEGELRQAQKMKAVGQLAGGIAHDFNNLLHVMLGHTELAAEKIAEAPDAVRNLEAIRKAGDRATSLVRQLLMFSRQQQSERISMCLNQAIANMLGMLRRVIGEHIEIQSHLSEEADVVFADPSQVDQILMNLCMNARDAMPDGGRIVIETKKAVLDSEYCIHHPWAQPGTYAMICISDNGPGIPRDIQDRIFEPFFTTKEIGKGTGLGLATVYGIVKQHEGLIHLHSEDGAGTTFRIFLPMARATGDPGVAPERKREVAQGTETILVAEDEEMIREMVEQILSRAGYQVILALNGEEAIEILEQKKDIIDFALLDVVMPKVNGKVVFERIRQLRPDMPVLFCTGYSRNILDETLTPEGDYEIIDKPYNPSDLLRQIRRLMDRAQAA